MFFLLVVKDLTIVRFNSFHDSLNSINQHISFTIEHESNGQLPFFDTLILRDNGKLLVDIYCKPTHTDRYLDFHSHHDRKHKISTAETLLHRALNLPNTQVGKTRGIARVCAALHSNGYPTKIAGWPSLFFISFFVTL